MWPNEVEFPREVRKQDSGHARHLGVNVAKNDDKSWEWTVIFQIGANFL